MNTIESRLAALERRLADIEQRGTCAVFMERHALLPPVRRVAPGVARRVVGRFSLEEA